MQSHPEATPRADDPRALWRSLAPFRPYLAWTALASAATNLLALVPTLFMLQVFDRVMVSQSGLTLIALTLLTLGLLVVAAVADWLRGRLVMALGVKWDMALGAPALLATLGATHDGRRAATASQVTADLDALRQFVTNGGVHLLFDLPWAVLYLAVLFVLHPILGAASAAVVIMLTITVWLGQRRLAPVQADASRALQAADATTADWLPRLPALGAMGMEAAWQRTWQERTTQARLCQQDAGEQAQRFQAISRVVGLAHPSLILGIGAWLSITGALTVGAMVAATTLANNATRPLGGLFQSWRQFIDARQAWARIATLLREERAPASEPGSRVSRPGTRAIALEQVTVRMPAANGEVTVLDSVSIDIAPGEWVAFTGPSGAGKSTLLRCVLGACPLDAGRLSVGGAALADWDREALAAQTGYLPQDIALFDGTLAENVARLGAPRTEDVVAATRAAGLHQLVLRYPHGYDTPLTAGRGTLPRGHQQRVALARALYGSPWLLVLDEPDSHLDEVGQAALVEALQACRRQGCTILMASHQKNLVALADRVIGMTRGQITSDSRQSPSA